MRVPLLVEGSRVGTVLIPRDTEPERRGGDPGARRAGARDASSPPPRERDELEAQVVETKALRRSNVVKTALLRSVSHDLRSPLTAITDGGGRARLAPPSRRRSGAS